MSFSAPMIRPIVELAVAGVATANADDAINVGRAPYACTVTAVSYAPDAAVSAGDGSNNRLLSLINKGQTGAGVTSVATLTNNANAWAADDEKAFTLSGTPANLVLAEGDILELNSDATGTGAVDPGGLFRVVASRT